MVGGFEEVGQDGHSDLVMVELLELHRGRVFPPPVPQRDSGGIPKARVVVRRTSLAMMFKLGIHAEKRWRRLNGHEQIIHLLEGKNFVDGIMQDAA